MVMAMVIDLGVFRFSGKWKSRGLLLLRPEDAPPKARSEGLRPLTTPRRHRNAHSILIYQTALA